MTLADAGLRRSRRWATLWVALGLGSLCFVPPGLVGCNAILGNQAPGGGDGQSGASGADGGGGVVGSGGVGSGGVDGTGASNLGGASTGGADGTGGVGPIVAVPGEPCPEDNVSACMGANQRLTLMCTDGIWERGDACSSSENCDTTTGLCTLLHPECVARAPGEEFCSAEMQLGADRLACGADRVTANTVEDCAPGHCEEQDSTTTCVNWCELEPCDENAACTPELNGRTCGACALGYIGDGDEPGGCTPVLIGLEVSAGILSPELDDELTDYTWSVPVTAQTVTLTPSAAEGVTVTIEGEEVAFGDDWTSGPLELGSQVIEVVLTQEGQPTRTYELSVRRGAYVKAENADPSDSFGTVALSSDGNTLVVGAPYEDGGGDGPHSPFEQNNAAEDAGAVYVFTRVGVSWEQQAYIKASNSDEGDNFGLSVAVSADGNTLAVGAFAEGSSAQVINGGAAAESDNSSDLAGAVYVFSRSGEIWTQEAYVKSSGNASGDQFGFSVALSADGNTLAASALGDSPGRVYVFTRAGVAWSEQAAVTASNAGPDAFGISVALSADGNTLAVGATGEDGSAIGVDGPSNENAQNSGAAYVFTRVAETWSEEAYIKASNTEAVDEFGMCVSLSADGATLAVGAPREDGASTGVGGSQANGVANSGAVYVFARPAGGTWAQQGYIKATNTGETDYFGMALALSGDGETLFVGATLEDSEAVGIDGDASGSAAQDSGAGYLYARSGSSWSPLFYVKAPNTDEADVFGSSASLSADGSLLAVGAPFEDSSAQGIDGDLGDDSSLDSGAVYLMPLE